MVLIKMQLGGKVQQAADPQFEVAVFFLQELKKLRLSLGSKSESLSRLTPRLDEHIKC